MKIVFRCSYNGEEEQLVVTVRDDTTDAMLEDMASDNA